MPEPLSPKIGFGMNVTLLPAARAAFLTTYLYVMTWSAMRVSVWYRRSISHWPPEATSWWWNSHGMPRRSSVSTTCVRDQQQVRLGDPLPATDGRAVEAEAVVEGGLVERGDRQRHVLPGPQQVAELEVDHLRRRLACPFERFARVGRGRGAVRQVVLRLFRHCCSFRLGPQKKSPGLRES